MNPLDLAWDYPTPHFILHTTLASEIDGYGHINNSVYLSWLDQCVWSHCEAAGMPPERCKSINRGFAAVRHEIDYISSVYVNEKVAIANWVTKNDGRLRAERKFQIIRISDQKTVLRAHSFYICTNLTSGRPCRMPDEFLTSFCATVKPES